MVGNGAVQIALLVSRPAPIVVCFGKLWIESNSFIIVGNGAVQIALLVSRNTPVVVCFGKLRVEANGCGEVGKRPVQVATFIACICTLEVFLCAQLLFRNGRFGSSLADRLRGLG